MTFPMSGLSRIMNTDETLTVMRRQGGLEDGQAVYVGGKLQRSSSTIIVFKCRGNVQPLTGRDLLVLPEGDRFDDQLWLWSNNRDQPLAVNDTILRQAKTYQIQSCEEWGSYTRCRLVLDDSLEDADL